MTSSENCCSWINVELVNVSNNENFTSRLVNWCTCYQLIIYTGVRPFNQSIRTNSPAEVCSRGPMNQGPRGPLLPISGGTWLLITRLSWIGSFHVSSNERIYLFAPFILIVREGEGWSKSICGVLLVLINRNFLFCALFRHRYISVSIAGWSN